MLTGRASEGGDRRDVRSRTAVRWVWACVALAACVRFFRLGCPPALTDEAFTYWRICGTFGDLLRALRPDGFVPLHYESAWLLTRAFGLDIWVLRLPGAIAGAAFPWAAYVLARSLWDRRAGVIAAVLAASSAWFAFFSRDAKMYMPAWCWMTAGVAFSLTYARSGRRRDLLLGVLFGVAAAGTHAVTLLVLAMTPALVAVLARRRRLRRAGAALAGTLVIVAGPALYYTTFSRWATEAGGLAGVRDDGSPAEHDNGLAWVGRWQSGRTPGNVLLSCASSYLLAYEWPSSPPTGARGPAEPWGEREAYVAARGFTIGVAAATAVGALVMFARRRGRAVNGRHVLLVTALVIAPLYGFYLRSFRALAPPWDLLPGGVPSTTGVLLALSLALVWQARRGRRPRSLAAPLTWVFLTAALLVAEWAAARLAYAVAPRASDGTIAWNNLWMPRYSAVVAPFLLATVAAALSRLPGRRLRMCVVAALAAINLFAIGLRVTTTTERRLDLQARDAVATIDPSHRTLLATDIALAGQPWYPMLPSPYYQFVRAADLPMRPSTFRQGDTWPFLPAPPVAGLIRQFRVVPVWMATARANATAAGTIILWRNISPTTPPLDWPGWQLTERQVFDSRHVWTWAYLGRAERCVYVRRAPAPPVTGKSPG